MNAQFPFTAIVGQHDMKQAMILTAIDLGIGGVLVVGDRGTGKFAAVRALASLLPKIRQVEDRPVNSARRAQCPACVQIGSARIVSRPTPVVDLPLGAGEDRVTGAFDIKRALTRGEKIFQPGLLTRANRGSLYIDEVNLLEDHIVDLLVDVAQSGENLVECDGLSIRHSARFVLVGAPGHTIRAARALVWIDERRSAGDDDLAMAAAVFAHRAQGHAVAILPDALPHRGYESRSDRLVVFVVDASGSAAVAHLAEAKGAVESLLADAYASRDHVALVAFRGSGAPALLKPTRPLTRAKRRLGALPGGGGTPLADGLARAFDVSRAAKSRGFDVRIVPLTDGRANVSRGGEAGRRADRRARGNSLDALSFLA